MMSRPSRHDVPANLVRAIEDLLKKELGQYGLSKVDVHGGEDHSGEPAIFIDAEYEYSREPIDPETLAKVRLAIVALVSNHGDDRFPYLQNHFDKRQLVRGFD